MTITVTAGLPDGTVKAVSYPVQPSDARWLLVQALDLEGNDAVLATLVEEWATIHSDHHDAAEAFRQQLEDLETMEANLHIAVEDDVQGKTQGERNAHRQSLVRGKFEWQEKNEAVQSARSERDRLASELERLEKRVGVAQSRLGWRSRMVGFLTSLPRMTTEQLPIEPVL